MKAACGLRAPKLQSYSNLVLSFLSHAFGNGTHIVLSSAISHLTCQKHFSVFLWYS